jgi:hypothetical protein
MLDTPPDLTGGVCFLYRDGCDFTQLRAGSVAKLRTRTGEETGWRMD